MFGAERIACYGIALFQRDFFRDKYDCWSVSSEQVDTGLPHLFGTEKLYKTRGMVVGSSDKVSKLHGH